MTTVRMMLSVSVAAVVLAAAACAGDGDSDALHDTTDHEPQATLPTTGAADPPFERFYAYAALGDGLVVIDSERVELVSTESGSRATGAALRLPDGTWVELPDPPPLWGPELMEVDGRVAVAGGECDRATDSTCARVLPSGAWLSADLESWEPIEFPDEPAQAEYGTAFSDMGMGFLAGVDAIYRLDPSDEVMALPNERYPSGGGARGFACPAGRDVLVRVEMAFVEDGVIEVEGPEPQEPVPEQIDFQPGAFTRALVLDATADDPRWSEIPVPPADDIDWAIMMFCGPDGPVIAEPGREFFFDGERIVDRSVQLPAELDERTARIASWGEPLDDGTVVVGSSGGYPYFLRHPDGTWESTGEGFEANQFLFVAGSKIYVAPDNATAAITEVDLGS